MLRKVTHSLMHTNYRQLFDMIMFDDFENCRIHYTPIVYSLREMAVYNGCVCVCFSPFVRGVRACVCECTFVLFIRYYSSIG